jgi:hypothetical protein
MKRNRQLMVGIAVVCALAFAGCKTGGETEYYPHSDVSRLEGTWKGTVSPSLLPVPVDNTFIITFDDASLKFEATVGALPFVPDVSITPGTNTVVGYFNYNSTEAQPLGRDDYSVIIPPAGGKPGCESAQGVATTMSGIRFKVTVTGNEMKISSYDGDKDGAADDQGFFAGTYTKVTTP